MDNNLIYREKYLKYKKKYLDLKIFKLGGNNLPSEPMNRGSYRKAIERGYKDNENLVLIIGSSNDQRFDNMKGFTLTKEKEPNETFEEDKDMLPLKYNILDEDFFNDFKDFKFNKIIFDYNTLYFIMNDRKFHYSNRDEVKLFLSTLINILNIGGELYIPINIGTDIRETITQRSNLSNNIKLDEVKRRFVVNNSNSNKISLSKNAYTIVIDGRRYLDETPYLTYLNNIKDSLNHNFRSEIDQSKIKLDFYIDQRYIDYYNANSFYVMEPLPDYDPNDTSFTYEPYPIEPRLIDDFTGDIKEYVKITRLQ